MNLKFPIIKGLIFVIALSVNLISPKLFFPQDVHEFDFNSDWSWDELTEYVVLIDPSLLKSVDELKKLLTVYDMRLILRELSRLNSLYDLKELSIIAQSDPENDSEKKHYWDTVFSSSLKNIPGEVNISNLLESVTLLTKIRKLNLLNDKFDFKERTYLYQPIKPLSNKINLKFDYSSAESLLDYFDNSEGISNVLESRVYSDLLNEKLRTGFSHERFKDLLKESAYDITLNNIYKWVYPQCYKDLGGVYIYKNKFINILNTVKNYESNIRSDVDKNISKYLDDSIKINADVLFMFGDFYNEIDLTGNNFILPLENFSDNYEYFVRYIIHNTVKIATREIQIPVFEYAPEYKDRFFVMLIMKIMDNGIANYIGAVGTETRPWNLLEKDFSLFNRTFAGMQHSESKWVIDSLIKKGFSGNAPFYTMSTQMAYIIETTLGRSSLIESISLGPVSFFSKYIKAYKEYPDEIRKVFRFSNSLEKKINDLTLMFPDEEIKNARRMRNSPEGNAEKLAEIKKFMNSGAVTSLKYFLCAQILLESGMFEDSRNYFIEGINLKGDKSGICGSIGKSFENEGAENIAMDFYNLNIEYSPDQAEAFEKRGDLFYKTGSTEKALEDYITALKLNPGNSKLQGYIKTLEDRGN